MCSVLDTVEQSAPARSSLVTLAQTLGARFSVEAATRDAERRLPYAEMQQVAASGLLAARVPAHFGGPEANFVDVARICLALGEGDPNIAQSIQPHLCLAEKLLLYGTASQQARYFARILDGALITNANAERGGRVVGETRTMLRRSPLRADNADYRLDGTKFYATGSVFAALLYITAVAEDGARAIVIVPVDRDGITIHDDWEALGQRTTASGTTVLDNVAIATDEIMWLPDHGRRRTHEGATAQLLHAAIDAGIAMSALTEAVNHGRCHARPVAEAGVERVGDDPYVLQTIGEMAVLAYGAVALVERAATILDKSAPLLLSGNPATSELIEASVAVALAKTAATDAALRTGEMLFRVGGASASLRIHNLDRHWRNARTHTLHDPVAYKTKMIGDYYMNDRPPPITTKY
jgi:alkylation response protein AidB-like acyl-CoA dehydrogenase